MAVIAAFKDGWTALLRNPVLLVAGLLFAMVGQLLTLGELTEMPAASGLAGLGWFLALPFALGGFVGMAIEAVRDGETSLGRFVSAGRSYYVRILVATVLLGVIVAGVFLVSWVLSLVIVVALAWAGGPESVGFGLMAVPLIGVSLLGVLFVPVALLFFQFYDTAVVVENESSFGALRRSAGLVRRNFLNVVGFSILWLILTDVVLPPESLVRLQLTEAGLVELPAMGVDASSLVAVPVTVLLTGVVFAYFYTAYTAYYVRLTGRTVDDTEGAAAG